MVFLLLIVGQIVEKMAKNSYGATAILLPNCSFKY